MFKSNHRQAKLRGGTLSMDKSQGKQDASGLSKHAKCTDANTVKAGSLLASNPYKLLAVLVSFILACTVTFSFQSQEAEAEDDGWKSAGSNCEYKLDAEGNLTIQPKDDQVKSAVDYYFFSSPSFAKDDVKSIAIKSNGAKTDIYPHQERMFSKFTNLETLDLSGAAIPKNYSNLRYMFSSCPRLTTLNLSGFDTSNVTDMSYMLSGCSSLKSINLNGLATSNVTNMTSMFSSCSGLESIDLSGLDTSHVTDMSSMFSSCTSLTSFDLGSLDLSSVTSMSAMFQSCKGLTSINLSDLEINSVTKMQYMFNYCSGLESVIMRNFNANSVTNMSGIFSNCPNLKSIDMSGSKFEKLSNIKIFGYATSLESVNMSGCDLSNVSDMSSLFSGCTGLKSIDLSGLNASKVANTSNMFSYCTHLTDLNLSGFDTKNVTNMSSMFSNCKSLESIDLSDLNTSKVANMNYMFSTCTSLNSLDLSNFEPDSFSASGMFNGSSNLQRITLSDAFNKGSSYSFSTPPSEKSTPSNPLYSGYWTNNGIDKVTANDLSNPKGKDISGTWYWQRAAYIVTFTSKFGPDFETQTVKDNGLATCPEMTTSITGYTFEGWLDGESVYDFTTPVASDLNLVANWVATKYPIVCDLDNGVFADGNEGQFEYTIEDKVITIANPTRSGYTFEGWQIKDTDTVIAINDDGMTTDISLVDESGETNQDGIELVAKWKANPISSGSQGTFFPGINDSGNNEGDDNSESGIIAPSVDITTSTEVRFDPETAGDIDGTPYFEYKEDEPVNILDIIQVKPEDENGWANLIESDESKELVLPDNVQIDVTDDTGTPVDPTSIADPGTYTLIVSVKNSEADEFEIVETFEFHVVDPTITDTNYIYKDVTHAHWGHDYIFDIGPAVINGAFNPSNVALGYMQGYSGSTNFGPDHNIIRGDAAMVIWRMAGCPGLEDENPDEPKFTSLINTCFTGFTDCDTDPTAYYNKAIAWCAANGIVLGYGNTGKFGPQNLITREEFASMVARFAEYKGIDISSVTSEASDITIYSDHASISDWALPNMQYVTSCGIMTGKGTTMDAEGNIIVGLLDPQANITRAEVAKMIYLEQPEKFVG